MMTLMAKALILLLAAGLLSPGLAAAQGGSLGVTGSSGVLGISGGNTISGSTVQGSTAALGNAAATAAQGLSGQNVNANLNTNQNTTGVNIGGVNASGEGYAGEVQFASPSQYIGFGSSTSVNLPQIPGFLGVPSNFSQPYKPDLWVNGPGPIVPSTLTVAQADECRASGVKSDWDGGERPAAESIELIWPSLGQKFPTMSSPASYLGTSKAAATEKYSFMATVCQAAYEAMKRGATKGIVTFVIRPKNRAAGIGFGGTSGGTGLASGVAATHPYALAGSLGFGTGLSRAHTEGELLMHIVGLREAMADTPKTSGTPVASIPSPPIADRPRDDADRARATEKAWFGAPATPSAPGPRAQTAPANGAARTDSSDPSPAAAALPVQQIAESPKEETPMPQRAPVVEKAWFGGTYGRSR